MVNSRPKKVPDTFFSFFFEIVLENNSNFLRLIANFILESNKVFLCLYPKEFKK